MAENFVVIVAAGVGSRMKSDLPKQFLLLDGRPVLMHTISAFKPLLPITKLIVVLSPDMYDFWQQQCAEYQFDVPHDIVLGGATRFQSVKNATKVIDEISQQGSLNSEGFVAVHDGARPIVEIDLINRLVESVRVSDAVIPAVQSTNSIRFGSMLDSKFVDRQRVWQVQTPQIFSKHLLLKAYEQEEDVLFTDDASVVEKMGNTIVVVEGSYRNIKITLPEDLDIAHLYLKK